MERNGFLDFMVSEKYNNSDYLTNKQTKGTTGAFRYHLRRCRFVYFSRNDKADWLLTFLWKYSNTSRDATAKIDEAAKQQVCHMSSKSRVSGIF